jgi:TonB family protein
MRVLQITGQCAVLAVMLASGRHAWSETAAEASPPTASATAAGRVDIGLPRCPAPPRLPSAAYRAEPAGKTTFHVVIDADGHVLEATVTTPSGPSRLHRQIDEAVLETLKTCQFRAQAGTPRREGDTEYVLRWK